MSPPAANAEPPSDREAFLDRLTASLRLPDELEDDVRAEMLAHIHDATGDLMGDGLTSEAAEQEVLRRLGSPEALGVRFRRTHQTTRRLLAGVGGGLWQGVQEGIRGYLSAAILGYAVLIFAFMMLQALSAAGVTSEAYITAKGLFTSFGAGVLCVAAGWCARGMVRGLADGARRRVTDVRGAVALVGGVVLALLVAFTRVEHVWLSVLLSVAIPVVFVVSALRTTEHRDPRPPLDRIPWPARWPRLRRVLFVAFLATVVGSMAIGVLIARFPDPIVVPPAAEPPAVARGFHKIPSIVRQWTASGFTVVAPRILNIEALYLDGGFPRDGRVAVTLPDNFVDWDDWNDLRVEAWSAASTAVNGGVERLSPGVTSPYLIVPVTDPWSGAPVIANVGAARDVTAYLLFITALDPVSGERVAFAWPESDEVSFVGNLVDWFNAS